MNFLSNHMTNTPLKNDEANFIATEAGSDLLVRLEWMTLQPKMVLELGEHGEDVSSKLREKYPEANFISGEETLSLAPGSVDLIFANMVLPWQQNIKELLKEYLRLLTPNGLLILSGLGLSTLQEYQATLTLLPSLVDMHDIGDALVQAGFVDPVLDVDYYEVAYQDPTKLLHELIAAKMCLPTSLSLLPNAPDSWSLTYEIIFAHTFAPLPNAEFKAEDGIVNIPLSHLRRQLSGS